MVALELYKLPGGLLTNDPHLPKLRKMLGIVQAAVANGEMSPRVGNVVMQQYADSLVARHVVRLPLIRRDV